MSLTFGLLLRRWRLEAGLSQEALAELAQISPGAVSSYERGIRAVPHRATVALLADVLGLTGDTRLDFVASARREPATSIVPRRNSNLRLELDSFVGRETAAGDVRELLERHRIVTITGDAGVGKTRLALVVAAGLEDRQRDGVWLADLGSLQDERDVVPFVAGIFDLETPSGNEGIDRLTTALQKRRMLVVFDNCEHLIGAVAALTIAIGRSCPFVTILCTSRERLRVSGEAAYVLTPLAVPSETETDLSIVAGYAAVRLFVERASAVDANAARPKALLDVAQLCRLVDGIPLAIEIVASRVDSLGIPTLRTSLQSGMALDISGNRDLSPRQRTMQATLEWSYATLGEAERVLFRRLGIFAGGWALEAAQAVCSDELLAEGAIRDGLGSLVAKSLLRCDTTLESPRYTMLHVQRLFANEKLATEGEREILAGRHAQWVLGVSRHAHRLKRPANRLDWHNAFDPELENARSALSWLMRDGANADIAAEIVCGLQPVWYENGHVVELRRCLDELTLTFDVLQASTTVAMFLYYRTPFVDPATGLTLIKRAIEIERTLGAEEIPGFLLNEASLERRSGDIESAKRTLSVLFEDLQQRQEYRSRILALAHLERSRQAEHEGRFTDMRSDLEPALEIFLELGEAFYIPHIRHYIADMEFLLGDVRAAAAVAATAVPEARAAGSRRDEMYLLCNLAAYRIATGDLRGAFEDAKAAIALARGRTPVIFTFALQHVAAVAALEGDFERAGRLVGFVNHQLRQLGIGREKADLLMYELLIETLCKGIPAEAARAALAETGARDTEDDAIRISGIEENPYHA
jgi:predicted ATPase/DNA-binding XRE family transcriptional regulator